MSTRPNRRQFLALGGLAAAAVTLPVTLPATSASADALDGDPIPFAGDPWHRADRVVRSVRRPRIPARSVAVTDFGAVGDGVTDATGAFRDAIAWLTERGGGRVVVPAGDYLTGAIHLESRIDLHVAEGATLLFSTDPAAYLPVVPTRDGGIECMNYSPFIYAHGKHDVAITGTGVLDGQADDAHWWPWAGKKNHGWVPGMPTASAAVARLEAMVDAGVPVAERVMGEGSYIRPSLIETNGCERVLISGVTVHRTPNWQIHPVLCTDVTVENVVASSHGPNNDGCDPESCRRVLIQGCTFDTGDDCIAIKAGKNTDGRRVNVPTEDVVIQDCTFLMGHGGITIGSEMTGGVRGLYARDCVIESTELNQGVRLKTNSLRGGFIEDVHVKNVTMTNVADSVLLVDFTYGEGEGHGFNPVVRNISLENVTVGTAKYPVYAAGYDDDHISGITLRNVRVDKASAQSVFRNCDDVTFQDVVVNGAQVTAP
ncbi:glycoside hydrolase family 28 protein [Isoptericola sp. F-RaC21]|uniref:glycoside hydrolase family 28 protein n=1 Tax=Isoptericola sp. F-RaC21 TaxID=3141452 RepID=UPI00315C3184